VKSGSRHIKEQYDRLTIMACVYRRFYNLEKMLQLKPTIMVFTAAFKHT